MLKITHAKLKLAVAVGVVAMLVLPGEAKTGTPSLDALSVAVAAVGQAAFGLFLDPHAEPVLHIELPKAYWSL